MKAIAFFLLLAHQIQAQNTSIKRLYIGDTVPDLHFEKIINAPYGSTKLSGINSSITILDFWATWCSACVYAFPQLDSIQKEFQGKVQLLAVNNEVITQEKEDKILIFLNKYRERFPGFSLPLAIENTELLRSYFPMSYISHFIWINQDRKIIAITGSKEITRAYIEDALNGNTAHIPEKKE